MAERKRRDYGSGSIYQRADGKWVGAAMAGWTERGTRRRITVVCATEAQAKSRLRKKLADIEAGAAVEVSDRRTVKSWADEWLPIIERELRPTSYTATASAVRRWIVPTIGHRRFSDLSPADVRSVADAMRKAGRSSSSQRRVHSDLLQLLKAAQAEGYPVAPRVLAVKAPEKAVSDRDAVPVPDALAMLAKAAEDPAGARWVAAFLQGLRQGEALGLTREAIDFERNAITISWQLQPLPYVVARDRSSGFRVPDGYEVRQVRGRWHLVRPKSRAGWRVVPMVPWMSSALSTWLADAPQAPLGLVWHHPKGDPPKRDDAAWYALQEASGVHHPTRTVMVDGKSVPAPYTIHEARHTTATLLLEAGVDPAVIAAILGHASIVTTRGYQHVRIGPARDALEKVAKRLGMGEG